MCEYCGCQEVTAIGDLTREHDEVVGLMSAVRAAHAAGDIDAMAVQARRIADILAPHTVVEEEGLFPLMTSLSKSPCCAPSTGTSNMS